MSADVVLIAGASASGKSRLIAGVQQIASESGLLTGIRVAERRTTRAARDTESLPTENLHLHTEAFERAVQLGEVDVHWRRQISAGHENRYGFSLRPELAHDGVVILSGNNYLNWGDDPLLRSLRDQHRLMVVRIWATPETRLARLMSRRPPLSDAELSSRMQDVPSASLPPTDHLIPNDPQFEATSPWDLLRLLAAFRFDSRTSYYESEGPIARGA